MTNSCLNCTRAAWKRTITGALHPSGDGRCQWNIEPIVLPSAFYFVGGPPKPSGGHIDRKKPYTDCKLFKTKE